MCQPYARTFVLCTMRLRSSLDLEDACSVKQGFNNMDVLGKISIAANSFRNTVHMQGKSVNDERCITPVIKNWFLFKTHSDCSVIRTIFLSIRSVCTFEVDSDGTISNFSVHLSGAAKTLCRFATSNCIRWRGGSGAVGTTQVRVWCLSFNYEIYEAL